MGVYEIDTTIMLSGTFANSLTGQLLDPSDVTLFIQAPGQAEQTIPLSALTHPSTGVYTYTLTPNISGVWKYKFQGTGNAVATSPDTTFTINASTLIAG